MINRRRDVNLLGAVDGHQGQHAEQGRQVDETGLVDQHEVGVLPPGGLRNKKRKRAEGERLHQHSQHHPTAAITEGLNELISQRNVSEGTAVLLTLTRAYKISFTPHPQWVADCIKNNCTFACFQLDNWVCVDHATVHNCRLFCCESLAFYLSPRPVKCPLKGAWDAPDINIGALKTPTSSNISAISACSGGSQKYIEAVLYDTTKGQAWIDNFRDSTFSQRNTVLHFQLRNIVKKIINPIVAFSNTITAPAFGSFYDQFWQTRLNKLYTLSFESTMSGKQEKQIAHTWMYNHVGGLTDSTARTLAIELLEKIIYVIYNQPRLTILKTLFNTQDEVVIYFVCVIFIISVFKTTHIETLTRYDPQMLTFIFFKKHKNISASVLTSADNAVACLFTTSTVIVKRLAAYFHFYEIKETLDQLGFFVTEEPSPQTSDG
ncbi:protein ORF21 [Lake sturgeon herpesvirus]|nr:protein ORF21 [Lake sturgeon herpesvirus]